MRTAALGFITLVLLLGILLAAPVEADGKKVATKNSLPITTTAPVETKLQKIADLPTNVSVSATNTTEERFETVYVPDNYAWDISFWVIAGIFFCCIVGVLIVFGGAACLDAIREPSKGDTKTKV